MTVKYREILKQLQIDRNAKLESIAKLNEQREHIADELEEEGAQLKKLDETIISFCRLMGDDPASLRPILRLPIAEYTLTGAIREVMKAATTWMTAVDVRNRMLENRFEDGKHDNLLASVHVTLKRLRQSGELLKGEVDGKAAYKLNPEYIPRIERMGIGMGTTPPAPIGVQGPSPRRAGLSEFMKEKK